MNVKRYMAAVTVALLCSYGLSTAAENLSHGEKASPKSGDSTLQFLKEITLARATSGDESAVRRIIRDKVSKFANLSEDQEGDLIAKLPGGSDRPVILIEAHMDEVGFQVRSITSNGFLKVAPIGLWYAPDILDHKVWIKTDAGEILGLFGTKPPHWFTTKEDSEPIGWSQLYVDIGAKDAEAARKMGVRLGDRIVPEGSFKRMADPNRLVSKAWDDRVGCAVIADVVQALSKKQHPNTVYAVWTTGEETGRPTVAVRPPGVTPDLVIVIEVGITVDTPDTPPGHIQEHLGSGPTLDLYDDAVNTPPRLRDWITRQAREAGIPLQFATYWFPKGTGSVQYGAILPDKALNTSILVPLRYAHTPNGIIDLRDYRHTQELLVHLLGTFGEGTWKQISGDD